MTPGAGNIRATMARGDLFILSAPSGAGKTTLIRHVFAAELAQGGRLVFSVSHTTRKPRPGERDGREYHFVDQPAFKRMVAADRFLEWAEVYGHFYGTAVDEVEPRLERGVDVLLDLDVQGADQVMARYPQAVSVFVVPPDFDALRQRLQGRGQDDPRDIRRRLSVSRWELERYARYRYVIVNDDAGRAGEALAAIILAWRVRLERMRERAARILESFDSAPAGAETPTRPAT